MVALLRIPLRWLNTPCRLGTHEGRPYTIGSEQMRNVRHLAKRLRRQRIHLRHPHQLGHRHLLIGRVRPRSTGTVG